MQSGPWTEGRRRRTPLRPRRVSTGGTRGGSIIEEGSDSCTYVVSESIVNAVIGAQLLSQTADRNDHIKRLTRAMELLLPAIVADTSVVWPDQPHQPHARSSTHSRSVKFSNVTKTTGSSRRISADLLILARTGQPS